MQPNLALSEAQDVFVARLRPTLKTALVVEGDPLVARSLAMILSAEAFAVQTALSGADGLHLAIDGAFDVLIIGADLPDMSGLEALSQLRTANVKSVVVFASVTPATAACGATIDLSPCTDSGH